MDSTAQEPGSAVARVIVARRAQVPARLMFTAAVAAGFHVFTGPTLALIWAAIFTMLQAIEFSGFRKVTDTSHPGPLTTVAFYSLMTTSTVFFASFGLLLSFYGGSWGVVCAGILWTGLITNAAIISNESRGSLASSLLPPLLGFLALPYFVIANGGGIGEGLAIVAGGIVNAIGTIALWSKSHRRTQLATQARETSRLALCDPETELPNRYAVQQQVAELRTSDRGGLVVVAAIGIDRFTHLRGAIGHALMLDLIRKLAGRFSRAHNDIAIARLSSGTLGVVFTAFDIDDANHIVARLQDAVSSSVRLRDNRVDVSVTIGLSQLADAVESAPELSQIDRAMIAVDQLRAARKSTGWFDTAQYGNPGSTLSLMSEMLRALDNGQMSVCYQPKFALGSGATVGAEALVRWMHPERGALRPDLFVQMAEETGHIAALTEWVLRRAVEDQRTLAALGHNVCISVNWSGHLINDVAFTDRALLATAHAAGKICLEVTETAIIGNPQLARKNLERFRAAGLTISIDDYGSGLSSLAYLKNIPADELKIDKAFVVNMATDPVDAVLVRSAVSLAHSLGLQVVAEGVENQGALELLRAMGCDLAQGYLIARPMPLADLKTYLGTRERMVG